MQIAQQIFRTLVQDTEVEIRKALSVAVKNIDTMPHDVVMELAEDVTDVSLPILEFSDVLTDADLVEIVTNAEDVQKQKSVSKRQTVSPVVSGALVDTGNEEVVDLLLQNDGADISEESYDQIVDEFADKDDIMESVVQRDVLPVEVMERLAEKVSDAVYKKLAAKHIDSADKIQSVFLKSREAATMKMIGMRSTKNDFFQFRRLMDTLHIPDDLAPIYALCMGNLNIFEVFVARITNTPVLNVRTLVEDETNQGFHALYTRANLPEDMYEIIVVLVEVLRELEGDLQGHGIYLNEELASKITQKMIERMQGKGHADKLDYIISLIENNITMLDNG